MNFQHHVLYLESYMMQREWPRPAIESFIDDFNEVIDKISSSVLMSKFDEAMAFAESNGYYLFMDRFIIQNYSIVLMDGGVDFSRMHSHKYESSNSKSGSYIHVPTKPKKSGLNDMAKRMREASLPPSLKEGSMRAPNNYVTNQLQEQTKREQSSAILEPDSSFTSISIDEQIQQDQEVFIFLQQLNITIEQDIHSQVKEVLEDALRRIQIS